MSGNGQWEAIAEGISQLLYPHGEVVLHDVRTKRILRIWNEQSGRQAGDESLFGNLDELDGDVGGPYETQRPDGRRITGVSIVLRDEVGKPQLLLSINLDRSPLDAAIEQLRTFAAARTPRPDPLFRKDWREAINDLVHDDLARQHRRLEALTREERRDLVALLDRQGTFNTRHAIPYVAGILKVSRSGLYVLLGEIRRDAAAPEALA